MTPIGKVFVDRYVIVSTPAFALLVAAAVAGSGARGWSSAIGAFAAATVGGSSSGTHPTARRTGAARTGKPRPVSPCTRRGHAGLSVDGRARLPLLRRGNSKYRPLHRLGRGRPRICRALGARCRASANAFESSGATYRTPSIRAIRRRAPDSPLRRRLGGVLNYFQAARTRAAHRGKRERVRPRCMRDRRTRPASATSPPCARRRGRSRRPSSDDISSMPTCATCSACGTCPANTNGSLPGTVVPRWPTRRSAHSAPRSRRRASPRAQTVAGVDAGRSDGETGAGHRRVRRAWPHSVAPGGLLDGSDHIPRGARRRRAARDSRRFSVRK